MSDKKTEEDYFKDFEEIHKRIASLVDRKPLEDPTRKIAEDILNLAKFVDWRVTKIALDFKSFPIDEGTGLAGMNLGEFLGTRDSLMLELVSLMLELHTTMTPKLAQSSLEQNREVMKGGFLNEEATTGVFDGGAALFSSRPATREEVTAIFREYAQKSLKTEERGGNIYHSSYEGDMGIVHPLNFKNRCPQCQLEQKK